MAKDKEYDTLYRQAKYVIDHLLYEPELSETQITFLNSFTDGYLALLNNHLNDTSDAKTTEKLRIYELALNIVYDNEELYNSYPAFKMINDRIENYNHSIEEKFAKVKKLEPPSPNAGFAAIVTIVVVTVILGILLGSLLWFIR